MTTSEVTAMKPHDQYVSNLSVCPFYKRENRNLICCSGLSDNSSVHLAFGFASDCKAYKVSRCRSDYSQCNVYRMLEDMNND